MTVFRKLQAARFELVNAGVKKTGHNKFGGWHYYELADFIPTVHKLFDAIGLCGVFNFNADTATLTIYDNEDGSNIVFSTPIVFAENSKGQPIQNLGSTHTYLRRYLWLMAMEIVESDAVDAMPQEEYKNAPKADPKPVKQFRDEAPKKPKLEPSTTPPAEIEGQGGQWSIKVTTDLDATVEQWAAAAGDAVQIALTQAQNLDDVVSIFRVNRTIFERMQADVKPKYDELMKLFATHKAKFKEKEEA